MSRNYFKIGGVDVEIYSLPIKNEYHIGMSIALAEAQYARFIKDHKEALSEAITKVETKIGIEKISGYSANITLHHLRSVLNPSANFPVKKTVYADYVVAPLYPPIRTEKKANVYYWDGLKTLYEKRFFKSLKQVE